MGTWKITDNFQLLGGVRNEYNDITFWGKKVVADKAEDIKDSKIYNVVLPMVNVKWNLSKDRILRAAYTRSFARPDFNDLNPGTIINDITNTVNQGNTKLEPTFSNNFDLMFENYFGKLDLVTAGVFIKILPILFTKISLLWMLEAGLIHLLLPKIWKEPAFLALKQGSLNVLKAFPDF